jgi:hypothetical protein
MQEKCCKNLCGDHTKNAIDAVVDTPRMGGTEIMALKVILVVPAYM